jgi:chromosome segregation protein
MRKKPAGSLRPRESWKRSSPEEELSGMLDAVTGHNNAVLAYQEEQGRLEARKAKMEAELETVQNKLWDEYGLTYGNALDLKVEIQNAKQTRTV